MREYSFAYTDSTGYFLINYAASAQGGATQNASATPNIYLAVANNKAEHVYLGATAFSPVLGQATYQTITLAAGEPILGDLPAEIKRVAMPPDAK